MESVKARRVIRVCGPAHSPRQPTDRGRPALRAGMLGSGSRSRMSTSVASDLDTKRASRGGGAGKNAIFAAKLLVTGACFWYLHV